MILRRYKEQAVLLFVIFNSLLILFKMIMRIKAIDQRMRLQHG